MLHESDWIDEAMTHERESEAQLRGELKFGEPMAAHTSWRVGGPADRFYVPADPEDLAAFVGALASGESPIWLGLGSNLLVRDGGIRGTVIATSGLPADLRRTGESSIHAGAGATCAKTARFAAAEGLAGAEFLAGIPGTIGGALAMNAGAFGAETWEIVRSVETLDRNGRRHSRGRDHFDVAYRSVSQPFDEWFLGGEFELHADTDGHGRERIRELLAHRADAQPTGKLSCGSVFRNPPGEFAGRLIEQCGLKGARRGGAVVSEKHGNFIINEGGATAADIEALIMHVRDAVQQQRGVTLEPEVRIVGEPREDRA